MALPGGTRGRARGPLGGVRPRLAPEGMGDARAGPAGRAARRPAPARRSGRPPEPPALSGRRGGGDALLAAFLASARSFRPDPALFVEAWRKLGELLSGERHGKVSPAAFDELDRASEGLGWPARHHSRGYAEAHAPAYRVLTGDEAGRLVRSLEGRP